MDIAFQTPVVVSPRRTFASIRAHAAIVVAARAPGKVFAGESRHYRCAPRKREKMSVVFSSAQERRYIAITKNGIMIRLNNGNGI
jgi:hypothetical protein